MEECCTATGAGGWARQSGRRDGMQRRSETDGRRVHAQQLGMRKPNKSSMASAGERRRVERARLAALVDQWMQRFDGV